MSLANIAIMLCGVVACGSDQTGCSTDGMASRQRRAGRAAGGAHNCSANLLRRNHGPERR